LLGKGTVFLVSHNVALTAAHNAFSREHNLTAYAITVTFGILGVHKNIYEVAYSFIPK